MPAVMVFGGLPGIDLNHGDDVQSYLHQCYQYLSTIVPLSIQSSGIADQADLDIRFKMWRTNNIQAKLPGQSTDIKAITRARSFLKGAKYNTIFDGPRIAVATFKQDLAEMALAIGDMIEFINKYAISVFTDEDLLHAMDVLQTLIDGKCINHAQLQKVLLRITRKRSLLPSYLLISGVQQVTAHPLYGGGFADVYKGKYLSKAVALKVLRVREQDEDGVDLFNGHKRLCKEALIWRQLHHPNILILYGVSEELFKPWFCLISPWMENGDLITYIRRNHQIIRLQIISMIAEGLQYLHSFGDGIIHGDLRGANILIDRTGTPRIADFGLTQFTVGGLSSRRYSLSSQNGGVVHWQAPELLGCDSDQDPEGIVIATKASDVYSFACVCLEVFTGKPPFPGLREAKVITAVAILGKCPPRPSDPAATHNGLDDHMWRIMLSCWDRQPENRPTSLQVLHLLYSRQLPFS